MPDKPFERKLSDGTEYMVMIKKSSNSKLKWNYIAFIEKQEFLKSANRITRPIAYVAKHLELLGKGDFTVEMPSEYFNFNDEVGNIVKLTDKM